MYKYQILIEYVGTHFVGWQIQKKGKSIQKTIQSTLSKLFKQKIILYSAGRTDREVHANEQSAHFITKKKINPLVGFLLSVQKGWSLEELTTKQEEDLEDKVMKVIQFFM